MKNLINFLPPVIFGLGLFIPSLIRNSPFAFPPKLKILATCIFAMVCWIAYYLVIGYGNIWAYENWVTGIAGTVAAALFIVVLWIAWKKKGSINQIRYFLCYSFGIFFLALASGNIVGQRDLTIITFVSSGGVHSVTYRKTNARDLTPLFSDKGYHNKKWSWVGRTESLSLNEIDAFEINGISVDRRDLKERYSGFPARRYEISTP